jgi:hypothetical protein
MQKMTDEEIRQFLLEKPRTAVLATVRRTANRTPPRFGLIWTVTRLFSPPGIPLSAPLTWLVTAPGPGRGRRHPALRLRLDRWHRRTRPGRG